MSDFFDAAQNGDLDKVKALLKDDPDLVFCKNNDGWTPLHFAVFKGSPACPGRQCLPDQDLYKGVAEFLLANKAKVNAKDGEGMTPLHLAAHRNDKELAELLLANKADVNAKDNYGDTPLHYAASHGNKDLAELLLANKAEINAKTDKCDTPLHYAVASYRRAQGVSENHRIRYEGVMELLRQRGGHE
jgi:ankyrin repeat protein